MEEKANGDNDTTLWNVGRVELALRCLRSLPHPPPCQFVDGQAALDAAAQSQYIRVETEGDLEALGIHVLREADYDATSHYAAMVVVTYDDVGGLFVRKSRNTPTGIGVEAVTDAVRSIGGVVTFGVGVIKFGVPRKD